MSKRTQFDNERPVHPKRVGDFSPLFDPQTWDSQHAYEQPQAEPEPEQSIPYVVEHLFLHTGEQAVARADTAERLHENCPE